MQFSERWLRSLVNPPLSTEQLAHRVTMAGLEVESITAVAPPFSRVVVAEILTAERHPDADRLQVCSVRVGQGEALQIVCGAPNARAGLKTACALVGATLPGAQLQPLQIRQAEVRGVASSGMLCSAKELGIATDADGIMELPADAQVGMNLRELLQLDDPIFTLKITPNRGDCLSVLGVARDVAALTGAALGEVDCTPVAALIADRLNVVVEAPAACPRYCGRVIRGIDSAARTPAWMAERLARSGLRCIHPVVDVTNYVLLELGEPMHGFDLARLAGPIRVRHGRPGERLALLNEQTIEPDETCLVIADDNGPLALAGIMGGVASAVTTATRDIFLEAAHFTPAAVAGRARRFALASDASQRFERGVDPSLPSRAMERATRLILEICGGQAGEVVSAGPGMPAPKDVAFRPERARRILGMDIAAGEMEALLRRLGMALTAAGDCWRIVPPAWRFDISEEVDLVEEVARLKGYEHIPSNRAWSAAEMLPQVERSRAAHEIKNILVSIGYQEVITYSFISHEQHVDIADENGELSLQNPISSQLGVMRGSLLPGLLQTLRHNLNYGQERLRVFEQGRCFNGLAPHQQPQRLAGLAYGSCWPEQWGAGSRPTDFYDIKGDIDALFAPYPLEYRAAQRHPALHPGQCASLHMDGQQVGWLGALHPRLVQKYGLQRVAMLFEVDWSALCRRELPRYQGISRYPAVRRDLAVVVDDRLEVGEILLAVRAMLPETITAFELFDLYQGQGIEQGKKSLAFRMLLKHTEKTLTEVEIEAAVSQVVTFLIKRFNAVLRA